MRKVKKLVASIVLSFLVAATCGAGSLATCTGSDPCRACKNCKYCKHCAQSGGTCGVCKPWSYCL